MVGTRCCSGLIVMQIKHYSSENNIDQEGAMQGDQGCVCPGAVTMIQSPAQLQSEVTQFLLQTVHEGGVVS